MADISKLSAELAAYKENMTPADRAMLEQMPPDEQRRVLKKIVRDGGADDGHGSRTRSRKRSLSLSEQPPSRLALMFLTICSWCVSWRWAVGVGALSVVGVGVASCLSTPLKSLVGRMAGGVDPPALDASPWDESATAQRQRLQTFDGHVALVSSHLGLIIMELESLTDAMAPLVEQSRAGAAQDAAGIRRALGLLGEHLERLGYSCANFVDVMRVWDGTSFEDMNDAGIVHGTTADMRAAFRELRKYKP